MGVNVGADLYLLKNAPDIINTIFDLPIHLTGGTGITTIPVDNSTFNLAFANQTLNLLS